MFSTQIKSGARLKPLALLTNKYLLVIVTEIELAITLQCNYNIHETS